MMHTNVKKNIEVTLNALSQQPTGLVMKIY